MELKNFVENNNKKGIKELLLGEKFGKQNLKLFKNINCMVLLVFTSPNNFMHFVAKISEQIGAPHQRVGEVRTHTGAGESHPAGCNPSRAAMPTRFRGWWRQLSPPSTGASGPLPSTVSRLVARRPSSVFSLTFAFHICFKSLLITDWMWFAVICW